METIDDRKMGVQAAMVDQVQHISAELEAGNTVAPVTVREFLHWYGVGRRGKNVVAQIRLDLKEHSLATSPDFEGAWIDSPIAFLRLGQSAPEQVGGNVAVEAQNGNDEVGVAGAEGASNPTVAAWIATDPSYQLSKLAAANQGVVSITPNDTLVHAVTVMMMNDYSQLPVMTNERTVQGLISWRTIGQHLSLGRPGSEARNAMVPAQEVRHDASIFDVIGLIAQHDYVLVRDGTNRISGILTATDLGQQFHSLSEPFLLLSEIENHIRNIIGGKFSIDVLSSSREPGDSREISSVHDLNFGEYVRLIENQERWLQMGLAVDRAYFCKRLDFVRQVRNDVMHFDPDGIQPEQLRGLRNFARALRILQNS